MKSSCFRRLGLAIALLAASGNMVRAQTTSSIQPMAASDLTIYHKLGPGRKAVVDANLHALYPDAALHNDTPGSAVLHCILKPDARLHDCTVVSETPAGGGFGAATLTVAAHVTIRPLTVNGVVVDQEMIEFPMKWRTAPR